MRIAQSHKPTKTFYENIALKTVHTLFVLRGQKKNIEIERTPWSRLINSAEVGKLLTRLNDSPATLYAALQKKQRQRSQNKFKLLRSFQPSMHGQSLKRHQKNQSSVQIQGEKQCKVGQQSKKEMKVLKKIEAAKKKYVEEYRKILRGIKPINLDTDLPRIKYVEQNSNTEKINEMHNGIKL